MSQNSTPKLRILALHGYTQSAEKFKEKSLLPRKFKKTTNFVFVTAPFATPLIDEDLRASQNHETLLNKNLASVVFKSPNLLESSVTEADGAFTLKEEPLEPTDYPTHDTNSFAWYLRRPNESKTGHYYRGIKECIEYIDKVFKEQGPFDGIFGFSQGACLVSMLCALQQKQLTKNIKFDFAIIASGYKFVINEFYDEILRIPSLHIYGETDQLVVPERSQGLANCFGSPLVISHPGGHYVPCNGALKRAYEPFFIEQQERKFGSDEKQPVIS